VIQYRLYNKERRLLTCSDGARMLLDIGAISLIQTAAANGPPGWAAA
jgi:hypothetical protein